jgi:hypothetical protein
MLKSHMLWVWMLLAVIGISVATVAVFQIGGSMATSNQSDENSQDQQNPAQNKDAAGNVETKPREQNADNWSRIKKHLGERIENIVDYIKRDDNDKVVVAVSTLFIMLFTALLFFSNIFLFISAEKSANAAKKAAQVAERALVAVERPILVVSLPNAFVPEIGRPGFKINIENVGKQIASTNGITANLIVQADSNWPITMLNDGSFCTPVPAVGQLVVKPSGNINITCRRQRPLAAADVQGINDGKLYAFFVVTLIYVDPLGNSRVSKWIGLFRPNNQFVQVFSADLDSKPSVHPPEEEEQNQRALLDTTLMIERRRGYPFPDK